MVLAGTSCLKPCPADKDNCTPNSPGRIYVKKDIDLNDTCLVPRLERSLAGADSLSVINQIYFNDHP